MSNIQQVNRRDFVKLFGLASGGILLGCNISSDKKEFIPQVGGTFTPNLFVQIQQDGNIILLASRSEMGQGIRTSLASAIADELEADWKYITVKQATGNAKYGNQNTDGSRSVRTLLEPMRKMGATAKAMLISAAAQKWKIPESDCKAENHFIINTQNKDTIFFGDLVEEAAKVSIPAAESIQLKKVEDFKFIGKTLKSVDLKDFTHGTANYGMDIRIPNMKFAAIARCPVTFGTVKSVDKTDAEKTAGVEKVIEIERIVPPTGKFFGALGGVAVIDKAIKDVTANRGEMGAFQKNNLESNLNYLRIAHENTVSSESVIRDADMAAEMAAFTRNQIMSEASTSMLAQANQSSMNVLKLLG